MDTKTVTLSEFLLARISEDEAAALKAQGRRSGHWTQDGASIYDGHPMDEVVDWVYDDAWDHIARHDPARVLADCEAKRRIVEQAQEMAEAVEDIRDAFRDNDGERARVERAGYGQTDRALSAVLRALAAVYADHADYRQEWRP